MFPSVSIIIPCLNEENTIGKLLKAIYFQIYPHSKMEVIISDGLSTDKTRQIIKNFAEAFPELKISLLDNKKKDIPTALNLAIRASKKTIIARLDAHSCPDSLYIFNSILELENSGASIVGGYWKIKPSKNTLMGKAIASALSNPFAVGNSYYHLSGGSRFVDSVPFGVFYRSLIVKIGFFNENLLSNEDYEFNTRNLLNGGRNWLSSQVCSIYYARSTLRALIKQYFRYGYWKLRMMKLFPRSIKTRQALPSLFVFFLFLSFFFPLFRLGLIIYFLILFLSAIRFSLDQFNPIYLFLIPLVIFFLHFSYGLAFLYSFFRSLFDS